MVRPTRPLASTIANHGMGDIRWPTMMACNAGAEVAGSEAVEMNCPNINVPRDRAPDLCALGGDASGYL